MKMDILFEDFQMLADAPNGVPKLRELILQIAIQGKLEVQKISEGTGKDAFVRNQKVRNDLIKSDSIKKPKKFPSIAQNEIPFSISSSWHWCRLGEVTNYGYSEKVESLDLTDDTWVLELQDVEKITSRLLKKIRFKERKSKSTKSRFKAGNVIYGKLRPYLDKVIVADEDGVCTTEMIPVFGYFGIFPSYLRWILKSPYFIKYANQSTHGMNLPRLGTEKARLAVIPIPPFKEQKRIVAKVDQLMALCDELEARKQKRDKTRIALNDAALDRLLSTRKQKDFNKHWKRIGNNFDLLYDTPETVNKLRQAILQLAVQGKLVPQDPKDLPATDLLEKIKAEKDRLIKEKIIKKTKPLPPITPDEIPYELPDGWEWVRLGNALLKLTDGTHHSPYSNESEKYKYVTAKNIKNFGIDQTNLTYVTKEVHKIIYKRCDPEYGDILYIKDGATTGIVTINNLDEQFSMLSSVALLKLPPRILNRFLLYVMRSPYYYKLMRGDMSGVAITRVTLTKLGNSLIPVAPFSEQKRIANEIDKFMTLCDDLEKKIYQSRSDCDELLNTIVSNIENVSTRKSQIIKKKAITKKIAPHPRTHQYP